MADEQPEFYGGSACGTLVVVEGVLGAAGRGAHGWARRGEDVDLERLAADLVIDQVVEASDGVSVDAVLSIKEATRIRVDGAPITNVFGNIYSTNCGATITTAVPPQPGASPAPATGMVNPAGEIVASQFGQRGHIGQVFRARARDRRRAAAPA